jgi:hypothetical protein
MAKPINAQAQTSDASTAVLLYTVPSGRRARVRLFITERAGLSATTRVSIRDEGAADNDKQYIRYDTALAINSIDQCDFLMDASDVLVVKSNTANVTFVANIYEDDIPAS